MDNIENTNEKSIGKFTKKFIVNFIIAVILIGIVITIINEVLSKILPTQIQAIVNFLISIVGLWKITSSTIETSLKEVDITKDDIKKVLKNIYIFMSILIILNIIYIYRQFHITVSIFSGLENIMMVNLITSIIAIIIQYIIIIMFCKSKLEQKILGKKINTTYFIVLIIVGVIILASGIFINRVIISNELM